MHSECGVFFTLCFIVPVSVFAAKIDTQKRQCILRRESHRKRLITGYAPMRIELSKLLILISFTNNHWQISCKWSRVAQTLLIFSTRCVFAMCMHKVYQHALVVINKEILCAKSVNYMINECAKSQLASAIIMYYSSSTIYTQFA